MNLKDIAKIRLLSQQIATTKLKTVNDIVAWMGAMQAQDYYMSKWAVGLRLPGATDKKIEAALNKGEIIRTHLLRPTWHLVSAKDLHWMLDLSASKIQASMKSRHKELELTSAIFTKSNSIIEKALRGGNHLTREEVVAELKKAKIATDNNRLAHLLFWAELDKIICSGIMQGNKQTYALLSERVKETKKLDREEALAKLAEKYFTSHSPATLQDFTWWSGLSAAEARHALEMVKPNFISETIASQTYWLSNSFSLPKVDKGSVYLLPAFDEFIISYKDRSAALTFEQHKKAVSENGIFRPVIVADGQVIGLWARTIKKDKVIIETKFFQAQNKTTKSYIENKAETFGNFLEKKSEVKHTLA